MDLSPSNMDNYTLVTQDEFESFINNFAPDHHRTAHTGGENYIDDRKITIAVHIIASGYYIHNDFIA